MPGRRTSAEDFSAHTYFVAVGIGTYTSEDFRNQSLKNPPKNVSKLVAALSDPKSCGIPGHQIDAIAEAEATKERILSLLAQMADQATDNDLVMLYFCGHGYSDQHEFYLCLADTKLADLRETAISGNDLQAVLQHSKARGVLLILDCCYSGKFAQYAPEIFRQSSLAEFRLLLAASGATQEAWDLGDEGSAFTKHLVRVLRAEEIVTSKEPHAIYLADLLNHSSRMMQEERNDHYPTLPMQTPQLVGFHGIDPLLFVLQPTTFKQLDLRTVRYSRAHVRLLFKRAIIALILGLMFTFGLTYTVSDHLKFIRNENDRLVIFRGHHALHLANLPRGIRNLEWHGDQVIPNSPLAQDGGIIQGTLTQDPVQSLVNQLHPKYRFLPSLYRGDYDAAYAQVKKSLEAEWPPTDLRDLNDSTVKTAAWLLARTVQPSDRIFFEQLALSTHLQVSALARVALAGLDSFPTETEMEGLDIQMLTYRARLITESLQPNCTNHAEEFLKQLSRINGTYDEGYIADALSRWGCKLTADQVFAIEAVREITSPVFFGENLVMLGGSINLETYRKAMYAAIQSERNEARKAELVRGLAALPAGQCEEGLFSNWLRDTDPAVYAATVSFVAKTCPHAVSVFPSEILVTPNTLPDLIQYNSLDVSSLHSLFQDKLHKDDMFATPILHAAGASGNAKWAPEIVPFLNATNYMTRQAAFEALTNLGYLGDEPSVAAAAEKHPLVIAAATRWVWQKDKSRGRKMAMDFLSNLPVALLLQIIGTPSSAERKILIREAREGSPAVKRNAACLLAARLPDSDLEEILDSNDLELQDYAYQCIAYRTDPLSVIKNRLGYSTQPEWLEYRLKRRQELLDTCNSEVARFPPWAQKWRRNLCVATDPSLALTQN